MSLASTILSGQLSPLNVRELETLPTPVAAP